MGNNGSCCSNREAKGPQKYASLTPEESFIKKKQHELKLFVYIC